MVFVVLKDVRIFVFFNSFVMTLVSFPTYVNVAHFFFFLVVCSVRCDLIYVSFRVCM
jgi:hypothetical protein